MVDIDFSQGHFEGLCLSADWIRDLEDNDSRLHKEKVIEKALMAAKLGSASAQSFLYNCYLAYNPFFVFHVQQVPESTESDTGHVNSWPKFWALCESLRTRSVTGNRARDSIAETMALFDASEWNSVCRRVLIKDLRCGISEKTLNKVLGNTDWRIPVFTCQLAQDSTEQQSKLRGHKRLEVKLDGVRVLAVVNRNGVTLYSRNGKEFKNFPQIEQALEQTAEAWKHKHSVVLDGEIIGESFQALMRQAHRKNDARTQDMTYYIFDAIPLADFERGHWNAQQHKRLEVLDSAREVVETQACLRIMPGISVDLDTAEGHDVMRRFATDAIAQGYEGIMIKSVDAPYQCKRSDFWLKWKPTITVDLTVVGMEPGTGRNQGRLGALVCEGLDQGRAIRVNVGSGFTDTDRTDYWQAQQDILGQLVEVQADAVTQNQDGTYSLRFPRFVRFRSFTQGDKI